MSAVLPPRARRAFGALVLLQALHSLEEYRFRFFEQMPFARRLGELYPALPRPGFVVLNSALAAFGLWCWLRVRRGAPCSRGLVGFWVAIELFNGVAHPLWSLGAGGYRPGLLTAPLLLALALYLLRELWRPARRAAALR